MAVTDTLRELREQVEQNLSEMKDTAALDALRVKVLGKKGTLTELLKGCLLYTSPSPRDCS